VVTTGSKYRSRDIKDKVIAFSISYQRENLLARGLGFDHLRELLIRLARPIVRQGASLAYGGNWRETDDNFTFELLRLISAEQEDNSFGGPDTDLTIGMLYNHSSWPNYLQVTPKIEAQWINCCRIVRVTQQQAGLAEEEIVPDADAKDTADEPRTIFNTAVTLSAMRRLMMEETTIAVPDTPKTDRVPPVFARILLGGSVDRYSGFAPGIFEEALVTLEKGRATYLLGGFGGATEILADAMLGPGDDRPAELTTAWHQEHNARLVELLQSSEALAPPPKLRTTSRLLDDLFSFVKKARTDLPGTLRTGLNDQDTRELLKTRDVATAVRLVRTGLMSNRTLPA
jgi:SLOG-like protein